jgi:hypothetical protein
MKELKYQTHIKMEDKLKKLIEDLKKAAEEELDEVKNAENKESVGFYKGRSNGFLYVAQWLTDILNSENPSNVSNQPDSEKH